MIRTFILATVVGGSFLTFTCNDSSLAQSRQVIMVLETIGKSAISRDMIVSLAEKSPALKSLAKQFGIASSDTAGLMAAFDGLPASARGAMILHDASLGETFLSSSRFRADLTQHESLVAAFNTLQTNKIGIDALPRWVTPSESPFLINPATRNVLATDTIKTLGAQPSTPPAALHLELPSGEVTLREPFVICDTPLCKIEIGNFNIRDVIKDAKPVVTWGAPILCAALQPCREKSIDFASDLVSRIGTGAPPSPPK